MKDNKEKLEEWVKIDAMLQEKLKDLEALEFQREEIISRAKNMQSLSKEIQDEMNKSVLIYENLAKEVSQLKEKAKGLKSKNNL